MSGSLQNNPLVGLAVPLMAGVALASLCAVTLDVWLLLLLAFALLAALSLFFERLSLLFSASVMATMLAVGAVVWHKDALSMQPRWSETKGTFSAYFLETPRMGDKTTKCLAMLTREDGDSLGGRLSGLCYLYLANCVEAENLSIGEKITFSTKIKNPHNAGNPGEFDYEKFLYIKGVTGTAYLPIYSWKKVGRVEPTLRMRALALREKVVSLYERCGFDDEVRSVLSALTIGDKSELTREIKETYSSVGASHVLALSGLHIGIFYMILSTLLPAWRSRRAYTILREILIISIIWGFAFIAGLSPSIVRAAILFTLFSLGRCARRDGSSLNALAFAAIAIIIFSPRSLFDVSFQLSFAAVLSIILLLPSMRRLLLCDRHGKVYNYMADLLSLSFVAQLGTLPIIWYCFGGFPLYFLLANIVVVPASFLVMSTAVLLWLTSKIAFVSSGVVYVLGTLIELMNSLLKFIEALPCAKISLPYIDALAAWGVAFTLAFAAAMILTKRRSAITLFFVSVFATAAWAVHLHSAEHRDYVQIYNTSQCTALHLVASRDTSYILSFDERDEDFDYVLAPALRRARMAEPLWVVGDYKDENVVSRCGLVEFRGRRVKMLCDKSWQEDSVCVPVDVLFLCRGFKGTMEELLEKYPAKRVIMDAGLHAMSRRRVAKECGILGVECVDVSVVGALRFSCADGNLLSDGAGR